MKISRLQLIAVCFSALIAFGCQQKTKPAATPQSAEEKKFDHFLDSLKKTGSSQVQTANEIRRYLAQIIDLGESKDSLSENYHQLPWSEFPTFHCIDLFRQNRLTAKCGLTSYILANLYNRAGIESYIYDCGYGNTKLTHEFVLVNIDGKLIVQDAFFNITIVDDHHNPKDFLEILKELDSGNFNDFNIQQGTVLSESWMSSKAEFDSLVQSNKPYIEFYNKHVKEVTEMDNRVRILVERNFNSFTTPTLERMKPRLKEDGLQENFLSIYLKPMHVKNGNHGGYDKDLENLIQNIVMN